MSDHIFRCKAGGPPARRPSSSSNASNSSGQPSDEFRVIRERELLATLGSLVGQEQNADWKKRRRTVRVRKIVFIVLFDGPLGLPKGSGQFLMSDDAFGNKHVRKSGDGHNKTFELQVGCIQFDLRGLRPHTVRLWINRHPRAKFQHDGIDRLLRGSPGPAILWPTFSKSCFPGFRSSDLRLPFGGLGSTEARISVKEAASSDMFEIESSKLALDCHTLGRTWKLRLKEPI
ncbi:hypothetical protein C9413_17805 [Rhizobium sp. SEMIA 4085]|nr:hypothetical protein [Rhizobium sp. SEMIA 4085]